MLVVTEIPDVIRELLACPRCGGPLRDGRAATGPVMVCEACALAYPVEEGIPVLLVERSKPLSD